MIVIVFTLWFYSYVVLLNTEFHSVVEQTIGQ